MEILVSNGKKVGSYKIADFDEIMGVNDRVALSKADAVLRKRINYDLMYSGVTIIDPERTYIEDGVKIGRDSVVLPGTVLEGDTVIGADCVIGPDTKLKNTIIGDGTEVVKSVGLDCAVGENTTVGPFAYLRPDTKVGNHCRIGDFVELKNSAIGDGTKVSHLTYVGDSDVGERVNFGCGTVTVNYDGAKNTERPSETTFSSAVTQTLSLPSLSPTGHIPPQARPLRTMCPRARLRSQERAR